jgi:hypothetical protein
VLEIRAIASVVVPVCSRASQDAVVVTSPTPGFAMSGKIDEINVLRAAILMHADSMLVDLRSIRNAKTLEEAKAPINRMIDSVNALSDSTEPAGEEAERSDLD